jgi:hypothetical protein
MFPSTSNTKTNNKKSKKLFDDVQQSMVEEDKIQKLAREVNPFTTKCKICSIQFTVLHNGENSIKDHKKTKRHRHLTNALLSEHITRFMLNAQQIWPKV